MSCETVLTAERDLAERLRQNTYDSLMKTASELGARQMQVVLLRDALSRFGQHRDYCAGADRCRCGLADALMIGSGAEAACGLKERE